jgi:hypothetical protein
MDILISLFSASVALAGFIAVFLVFRYRQIDTYVDSRKATIRSLLENDIKNDSKKGDSLIDIMIQDIGKNPQVDYIAFFRKFNKAAVDTFVNHIHAYRRLRKLTVWLGLTSIVTWGTLSLVYLIIYAIRPCLFSSIRCSVTLIGISIGLFISSMIFTLCFVFISLLKKPE